MKIKVPVIGWLKTYERLPQGVTPKSVTISRQADRSKTCSNCGQIKESVSLSERVFKCDECQFECDRDLNASINLEKAASLVVSACGLDSADASRLKQEENGSNC